jgi:hypothetical protein
MFLRKVGFQLASIAISENASLTQRKSLLRQSWLKFE